ncbi:MAG: hypothetical protein ABFC56_02200, partial [Clostridiaceae bacterium]
LFSFIAKSVNVVEKNDEQLRFLFDMAVKALIGSNVYGSSVQQAAASFIYGVLAETERRGKPRTILSALGSGAQKIQSASQGHLFESQLAAAVCQIERLCRLDEQVAHRDFGRRSCGSVSADRRGAEETDVLCAEGNPEESYGNCGGSGSGHENAEEGRFFDHCSLECVLAALSEFEVLLGRQQLDVNCMGHVVSADSVREHQHGSNESEKQNHVVFDGMCRQILEKYTGKSGADASAYVSFYERLRHTSRDLGNRNHDRRSICELADKIARGIRLSDSILGTGRFQALKEKSLNYSEFSGTEVEEFAESLFEDGWEERVGNAQYASRVRAYWRLHREKFLVGLRRMFGWLSTMRRKWAKSGIDIGMECFSIWFGSRELASYFRKLILGKVAATDNKYAKNVKTKTWWFYAAFKERWLAIFEHRASRSEQLSEERFAAKLGNGRTHETLKKGVVHVFFAMKGDLSKASQFLHRALEASSANDKRRRHKEIDRYLLKIHRRHIYHWKKKTA